MSILWKAKREINRLGQQILAVLESFYAPYFLRRHDRFMAEVHPLAGQIPPTDKIALYLIYQPKGLDPDILAACDFLCKAGYAPFVVSNAALTQADMDCLLPRAWQVLSRPNFGRCFGGYRDGILKLLAQGQAPRYLAILNDSVLFPIVKDADFLRQAEQLNCDIAGGIFRARRKNRYTKNSYINYLESYFLLVSQKGFAARVFQEYWKNYTPSESKFKVVRAGERGFSRAMQRGGLSLGALHSNAQFLAVARQQTAPILRQCLRYCAFYSNNDKLQCEALLSRYKDGQDWRADALDFMARVLQRDTFNSAFCFGAVRLLGFPFLKKSPALFCVQWRKVYRQAVRAADLPPPPKEILQVLDRNIPQY